MMLRYHRRDGFALAAVLWVLTVAAVVGAATALQGHSTYDASRNRTNAERAFWIAEGCAAQMRAAIDQVLVASSAVALPATWRQLDAIVIGSGLALSPNCRATLVSVGSTIDVNTASDTLLHKYFANLTNATAADAFTDALLDWRDSDDVQRLMGAERAWYTASKRPTPRNASLASVQELSLVRHLDARPDLTIDLGIEPSLVCLTTAPAPVLAALPGFTAVTVQQVLDDRKHGVWFGDLNSLRGRLPRADADSLLMHFSELSMLTVVDPPGWILRVTGSAGLPSIEATDEMRLDRYASRAYVLRRQTQ